MRIPDKHIDDLRKTYDKINKKLPKGKKRKIEKFETILEVEKYRWDFKPKEVKGLIIAESHTLWPRYSPGVPIPYEKRPKLDSRNPNCDRRIHEKAVAVGLIYCPLYGDNTYPSFDFEKSLHNARTNFWLYVFWPAIGENPESIGIQQRSPWNEKRVIIDRLMERGIWLVDASLVAVYLGNSVRDEVIARISIPLSWKYYLLPLLEEEPSFADIYSDISNKVVFVYKKTQESLLEIEPRFKYCKNANLQTGGVIGSKRSDEARVIKKWADNL